jgi:hypothetical protein
MLFLFGHYVHVDGPAWNDIFVIQITKGITEAILPRFGGWEMVEVLEENGGLEALALLAEFGVILELRNDLFSPSFRLALLTVVDAPQQNFHHRVDWLLALGWRPDTLAYRCGGKR